MTNPILVVLCENEPILFFNLIDRERMKNNWNENNLGGAGWKTVIVLSVGHCFSVFSTIQGISMAKAAKPVQALCSEAIQQL